MSHSPEPWSLGEQHETMCRILDANNNLVAVAKGGRGLRLPGEAEADPYVTAERIVACVSACRGIPNDILQMVAADAALLSISRNIDGGYQAIYRSQPLTIGTEEPGGLQALKALGWACEPGHPDYGVKSASMPLTAGRLEAKNSGGESG